MRLVYGMRRPVAGIVVLVMAIVAMPLFAGGAGERGSERDTITLTYAENVAEVDPIAQGAMYFADRLSEYTDGRYQVEVLAGGQLGQPRATQMAVQTGTIEMARTNTFFMAEFGADVMSVMGLPFLFQNTDHAWRVMTGPIGEELLDQIDGAGLGITALGFYIAPPRNFFFTNRSVRSINDMRGLNIRVPAGLMAEAVTAFGASATPVDFSELYSALQTGVVDGAENPVKGFYNEGFYEVAKYYTYSNHQIDPSIVFINTDLWNSISPADQQAFRRAFGESQTFYRELEEREREEYVVQLEQRHGVQFVEVDNPREWVDAVQRLYDRYGANYRELIDRIQAEAR